MTVRTCAKCGEEIKAGEHWKHRGEPPARPMSSIDEARASETGNNMSLDKHYLDGKQVTFVEHGGPGRITQVFNVGPSPGVLTESGALFILGREGNTPDGAVKWDCIRAPNKSDLENEFK